MFRQRVRSCFAASLTARSLSELISHDTLLHCVPFLHPARPQQKYDYFKQSQPRIRQTGGLSPRRGLCSWIAKNAASLLSRFSAGVFPVTSVRFGSC